MAEEATQQPQVDAGDQRVVLTEELPTVTVVIPAWNEAARILPTLEQIRDYMLGTSQRCEFLVVDDASTDSTAAIVRDFARETQNVRLIVNPRHRGKGYCVRQAMLVATGDLILMTDADLSAPIEEFEKLRALLAGGHEVVIGSRDLADSVLDPPQPATRRRFAGVFRALRRLVLLRHIRDTQCGFKLFTHDAARRIFSEVRSAGWLFDCEVLGVADRLGYDIAEVGIRWRHRADSRVRLWREVFTALPTLLAIRWRLFRVG